MFPTINATMEDFTAEQKRNLKKLRKLARQFIRKDLQRRAITGEPWPFKRSGGQQ